MSSNKSVSTQTTASLSTQGRRYPKKIFMDVSPSTTEAGLRAMLERYHGQVNHAHIHTNRDGRAMAFVVFRWHEDAEMAIQSLDGSVLDGLVLRPQWATPRKRREDGNGAKKKKKSLNANAASFKPSGSNGAKKKKKSLNANAASFKPSGNGGSGVIQKPTAAPSHASLTPRHALNANAASFNPSGNGGSVLAMLGPKNHHQTHKYSQELKEERFPTEIEQAYEHVLRKDDVGPIQRGRRWDDPIEYPPGTNGGIKKIGEGARNQRAGGTLQYCAAYNNIARSCFVLPTWLNILLA